MKTKTATQKKWTPLYRGTILLMIRPILRKNTELPLWDSNSVLGGAVCLPLGYCREALAWGCTQDSMTSEMPCSPEPLLLFFYESLTMRFNTRSFLRWIQRFHEGSRKIPLL